MPPPRDKNGRVLLARALRRNMTLPEGLLWRELRKRPGGFKFRRQHPCGRYIVDFYCPAVHLVVEVDGISHELGSQPNWDARRDECLCGQGLQVIRVRAADVLNSLNSVMAAILEAAGQLPLHRRAARDGSPPHDFVAGRN